MDDELKQAEEYAKKQAEEEARMRKSMWAMGEEVGEDDEHGGEGEDETKGKSGEEQQEGTSRRKRRKHASSHKIVDSKKKKQHDRAEEEEVWVEPMYDSSEFVSGPILTPDVDLNINTLRM